MTPACWRQKSQPTTLTVRFQFLLLLLPLPRRTRTTSLRNRSEPLRARWFSHRRPSRQWPEASRRRSRRPSLARLRPQLPRLPSQQAILRPLRPPPPRPFKLRLRPQPQLPWPLPPRLLPLCQLHKVVTHLRSVHTKSSPPITWFSSLTFQPLTNNTQKCILLISFYPFFC